MKIPLKIRQRLKIPILVLVGIVVLFRVDPFSDKSDLDRLLGNWILAIDETTNSIHQLTFKEKNECAVYHFESPHEAIWNVSENKRQLQLKQPNSELLYGSFEIVSLEHHELKLTDLNSGETVTFERY